MDLPTGLNKNLLILISSGSFCSEIFTLAPQQVENFGRTLRTPCSYLESSVESGDPNLIEIETISNADFDLNQSACKYVDLNEAKINEETNDLSTCKDSLQFDMPQSSSVQLFRGNSVLKMTVEPVLESIDETPEDDFTRPNQILDMIQANESEEISQDSNVSDSITFERKSSHNLEEFQKSFKELEAHFIKSVRSFSRCDDSSNTKVIPQPDKEIAAGVVTSKLEVLSMTKSTIHTKRRQHDASAESLTDDETETEISSTKIDDNCGKVGDTDISTSASTEGSKQLQVLSLIDDVSASALVSTRACDANLALMQEIRRDNAMEANSDDDEKEKFELSQKSHETSSQNMTWQSSNPSSERLHKASTFTSMNDIFERRMESLRKRAGDESESAARRRKHQWCDGECIPNEVVKHVYNFDNE